MHFFLEKSSTSLGNETNLKLDASNKNNSESRLNSTSSQNDFIVPDLEVEGEIEIVEVLDIKSSAINKNLNVVSIS